MARAKVAPAVAPEGEVSEVDEAGEPDADAGEAPEVAPAVEPELRMETFEATRPDGTIVVVTRNIDTGEQTVIEK